MFNEFCLNVELNIHVLVSFLHCVTSAGRIKIVNVMYCVMSFLVLPINILKHSFISAGLEKKMKPSLILAIFGGIL